jgi:hypothetical protein
MISRLVCFAARHPSGAHDHIFVTVKQLLVCCCGATSLTRGTICNLQLLQDLFSEFSDLSPERVMTMFCCLNFETPPTCMAMSSYLYPYSKRLPSYTPRHCVVTSLLVPLALVTKPWIGPNTKHSSSLLFHSDNLENTVRMLRRAAI